MTRIPLSTISFVFCGRQNILPKMLKNYLKIIFRNMTKNKVYVLINIIGLGLALAVCIVAYLNYKFDADFDTCHENRDRIYRIEHTQLIEGDRNLLLLLPVSLYQTVS